FVHAKTMVCDGQVAFVGTTNLDHRSFELNFEIHQVIYDANIAVQLRNAFYDDLNNSEKIDKAAWSNRSPIPVFIERIARLISPVI
ncbi:MAG: cardiolipin synthase, partial [Chitinophagaceae bacterium]|nr:cardiolipin synthase [Chitinophagaceae bacterium]